MIQKNKKYILGVDGGASNTKGIIFTNDGITVSSKVVKGTNVAIYGEKSAERIGKLIIDLTRMANIEIDDIDSIGLGLAGSSNDLGRELVFKEIDKFKLSKKAIIVNDAEAVFEINCPGEYGFLVTVGTGVICISKDDDGKFVRVGGLGHDEGDMGSGYWLGKELLLQLALNETSVFGDVQLEELMSYILKHFKSENFQYALEYLNESNNRIAKIASLAKGVIYYAEQNNEIALEIVQKATHHVAEYIVSLADLIDYKDSNIVLAGNGSVIKNSFFRKMINDELKFNFKNVKWTFLSISPAYGAGILSAKMKNINVKISDILKGSPIVSS
tara:strand:- start:606 stop:1595 length:990 start_codon:yes stop_codon:yes gene_type:complete